MITNVEHSQIQNTPNAYWVYEPDLLPRLQVLLAALADIDAAHERSLEVIKNRPGDDAGKDELIADLLKNYCEQRASYVRELSVLKKRMETAFG